MIDTSKRIQTIAKSDLKSHTVKQMRKDVAQMIKIANRINAESGSSEINLDNINYFLGNDFRINKRGGFSANFNYYHSGKPQLRSIYNRLAQYINADVDSSIAVEKEKRASEKFIAYVNGFDPEDTNNITPEDAQIMYDLKDSMPELFDGQNWFYMDLPIAVSKLDKKPNSVLEIALSEKKKLMHRNKSYTQADLRKNIIKAIENAQNVSRKREYSPVKKKDRKSARLSRKAKRR